MTAAVRKDGRKKSLKPLEWTASVDSVESMTTRLDRDRDERKNQFFDLKEYETKMDTRQVRNKRS